MSTENLNCPSCGGSINLKDRFSKLAICEWCGTTLVVKDHGLDPTGKTAKLADYPSRFSVGCRGTITGKKFTARGRLRYDYGDGFWDEWYIVFVDGKKGWLQEDEGEFAIYHKQKIKSEIPDFDSIRVGSRMNLNDYSIFVSEKGSAEIAGGEGELLFEIYPGETVKYFEGNADGKLVSVEFSENEIGMSIGEDLDFEEVVLEGE